MIDARQGANDRCGGYVGTDHRVRGARRPAPEIAGGVARISAATILP
ncbi:hypothetical protein FraQA3DRAFT_2772 [Frankia sp. QA3]|nr:hypothetical protein FraQA3DRAFT_2772 [Frankia sp. QA3]